MKWRGNKEFTFTIISGLTVLMQYIPFPLHWCTLDAPLYARRRVHIFPSKMFHFSRLIRIDVLIKPIQELVFHLHADRRSLFCYFVPISQSEHFQDSLAVRTGQRFGMGAHCSVYFCFHVSFSLRFLIVVKVLCSVFFTWFFPHKMNELQCSVSSAIQFKHIFCSWLICFITRCKLHTAYQCYMRSKGKLKRKNCMAVTETRAIIVYRIQCFLLWAVFSSHSQCIGRISNTYTLECTMWQLDSGGISGIFPCYLFMAIVQISQNIDRYRNVTSLTWWNGKKLRIDFRFLRKLFEIGMQLVLALIGVYSQCNHWWFNIELG